MFNLNFDYTNAAIVSSEEAWKLLEQNKYEECLQTSLYAKELFEQALEEAISNYKEDTQNSHPEQKDMGDKRWQVMELINVHISRCNQYISICEMEINNQKMRAYLKSLRNN